MNIYLDDDSIMRELIARLRKEGHTVVLPADVNLAGAADAIHFEHTIRQNWVILTRNVDDYRGLHKVVIAAGGTHPGILLICSENDRTKDMTPAQIVKAVSKLVKAGVPLENEIFTLNHWR